MNVKTFKESVTFPLSLIRSPVWLIDVDNLQVVWANSSALALCEVEKPEELQDRSITFDLSCKALGKLGHHTTKSNSIDNTMTEVLTLYPDGQPVIYECSLGSMTTPAGDRWLMINGIQRINRSGFEALYRNHALLHTSVCVSMYALNGTLKYSNPSARSMLGSDSVLLSCRFHDHTEWQAIQQRLLNGEEVRTESKIATAAGFAWHGITLEICPDPVLAEPVILVTEIDVSARRKAQQQIQKLAYYDDLTGLPNRTSWYQQLETMLDSSRQCLSVLFMDIDGFKSINDTYGHEIGDKLLIAFGLRVSDCLDDGEFLARLGGDEFTLLMPDDEAGNLSTEKAKRILRSLANPINIDGHEVSLVPSIGISCHPADVVIKAAEIMQQADMAMYTAKSSGGGFNHFNASMPKQVTQHCVSGQQNSRSPESRVGSCPGSKSSGRRVAAA